MSFCTQDLSAVGKIDYTVRDNMKGLSLIQFNTYSVFPQAHLTNCIPTLYAKL